MPEAPDRITGTVTTYFEDRGFGFITTLDIKADEATDVFFHISEVKNQEMVQEHWRMKCTPDFNHEEDGWEAKQARIISKNASRSVESSSRKPWYRRSEIKETKQESESVDAYGKEIMEKKSESSDSDQDENTTKYDQSNHA